MDDEQTGESGTEEAKAPKPGEHLDFKPITSQAALDHIIEGRVARERKKFADYDELKAAAEAGAQAAAAAESSKARIADLEAELEATKAASTLAAVSAETGVPAELLQGSSEEELRASAEKINGFIESQRPASGAHVRSVGSSDADEPDPDAVARAFLSNL